MIKYAVILATLAVFCQAQRSPYAGRGNRQYPQVLPQYLPSVSNTIDTTTQISRRFGEVNGDFTGSFQPTGTNNVAQDYGHYDPYNDQRNLDYIATWPREHQPFWYLNRNQINQQVGINSRFNPNTNTNTIPNRPFYAGRR